MSVAVLYDVHGNLPALEAVLREVVPAGVDRIVVGGDVMPGPLPTECLDALRGTGIRLECISGNGELDVLAALDGADLSHVPPSFRDAIHWCAAQLRSKDIVELRTWPATRSLNVPGCGDILFCHATPRSARELFTERTPEAHVEPAFAAVKESVVVCGHTHMQFDRPVGTRRVVNAGSVGMPFGEPGAHWLLLSDSIELRRTAYDVALAASLIRATPYPASEFAASQVTSPTPAAVMLERYEQASI